MTVADPPWLATWQAAQRELLEGWPELARRLWETLQGFSSMPPGTPPDPAVAAAFPGAAATGFAPPWPWPALGATREEQEAWERLRRSMARLSEVQARLTAEWGAILQRSLAALGARLQARASSGQPVETLRSLYDLWIEAAEEVYARAAATSPWVELQAELANAGSELRICQCDLLERWARQFDLPTRSELDAVHRRTRALEAAVRTLEAAQRPPAAKSARTPMASKASKASRASGAAKSAKPARASRAPAPARGRGRGRGRGHPA